GANSQIGFARTRKIGAYFNKRILGQWVHSQYVKRIMVLRGNDSQPGVGQGRSLFFTGHSLCFLNLLWINSELRGRSYAYMKASQVAARVAPAVLHNFERHFFQAFNHLQVQCQSSDYTGRQSVICSMLATRTTQSQKDFYPDIFLASILLNP